MVYVSIVIPVTVVTYIGWHGDTMLTDVDVSCWMSGTRKDEFLF